MNAVQKCVVREVQKKYFEFGLSPHSWTKGDRARVGVDR